MRPEPQTVTLAQRHESDPDAALDQQTLVSYLFAMVLILGSVIGIVLSFLM